MAGRALRKSNGQFNGSTQGFGRGVKRAGRSGRRVPAKSSNFLSRDIKRQAIKGNSEQWIGSPRPNRRQLQSEGLTVHSWY